MLAWSFRVGVCTVRNCIPNTNLAQPNETEWKKLHGKHVHIKCPPKTWSLYFSFLVLYYLLHVLVHRYNFTAVDIGAYGSQSGGGVLKCSGFGNKILDVSINIPKPTQLPNSAIKFQYYNIDTNKPYLIYLFTIRSKLYNLPFSTSNFKIELK